ncbi:lymphoid-specific helicase-like, partial [Asbolus verrucosus]
YPDITKKLKYFERGSLRPYQIEGVTWLTVLFENCINGILADEMGLGKTIQIIALFCHLYERKVNGPFLIVAPLSTLGNWESEFKKFAPQLPVVRLQGNQDERRDQIRAIQNKFILDGKTVNPIVICSYQVPQLEEQFLKRFCWTYIVVDEGHRIKNPDSKLSQELRALNSENRVLLTGTPLQNNIKELWALFNFLMPELFKDIEGFSSLVELEDVKDKDKILENEAQTKIISTIHKVLAPFMLRREKKYVLTDIIPKKEMIIYCPLTDLQKYIYRAILKQDVDKLLMRKPEEPENPMVDLQAQDRCHRIGQTRPVMIYSLIVKNTIDEMIVSCGDMKKRLEKIVIKEGKFKTLKKCPDENELQELEKLLSTEEKLTKIHANGLMYTDNELNRILDRSELIEEMKNNANYQDSSV